MKDKPVPVILKFPEFSFSGKIYHFVSLPTYLLNLFNSAGETLVHPFEILHLVLSAGTYPA
ncbi:MAG: hypothetical protein ACOH2V_00310 [Candidatus Saccharimonadaceae bacterium]